MLLAAALALAGAVMGQPEAARADAEPDTTGPEVGWVTLTPTVDVGAGAQTATAFMQLIDPSGVNPPFAALRRQLDSRMIYASYTTGDMPSQLVDGDVTDGVWRFDFDIPLGLAAGDWDLVLTQAFDSASNLTVVDSGLSVLAVENSGVVDEDAPVISDIAVSRTTVDVTEQTQEIEFSFTVTDVLGLDSEYEPFVYLEFDLVNGMDAPLQLVSGDLHNGVWAGSVRVYPGAVPGDASLLVLGSFVDLGGNRTESFFELAEIDVINDGDIDSTAPQATVLSVSPSVVEVGADPTPVTIRVEVADPATARIRWLNYESDGRYFEDADVERVSGDDFAGVYDVTIPIRPTAAASTISLHLGYADAFGNWAELEDLEVQVVVDDEAPTASAWSFSPGTVTAGGSVTVSVRLVDPAGVVADGSGILAMLRRADRAWGISANLTRSSGTNYDGIWTGTFQIPVTRPTETLELELLNVEDGLSNRADRTATKTLKVTAAKPTGPVPTISGAAKVGSKLTAVTGTWTPKGEVGLNYQWYRGSTPIPNAKSKTYTLAAADANKAVSVKVSGAIGSGAAVTKASTAVAVKPGDLTAKAPTISGTARVGEQLRATVPTWAPSGVKFSYQWLRNGKAIASATKSSYTLAAADKGQKISLKVTGSLAGYTAAAKTSAAKTVAAGVLKSATPEVTGTFKVGKTLTAQAGSWTAGTTLKYQWFRDGVAIKGATSKTYKLVKADGRKMVTVKVTGSKAGYTTVTKVATKILRVLP